MGYEAVIHGLYVLHNLWFIVDAEFVAFGRINKRLEIVGALLSVIDRSQKVYGFYYC
jgi:hypothetical protein